MGRKAQEGATQHVWEGEFWTVSEVERTTEGSRAPQVHLFTKLWKIMFPFFLPHRLTRFPFLAVLLSSSCSPSFPHFPFLLTKKERKSANPVLAELELCVQAEYIDFFFPFPAFLFFMWLSVQWDLEKVTFIPKGIKRRMLSCTPRVWQLLDGIIYIHGENIRKIEWKVIEEAHLLSSSYLWVLELWLGWKQG